MFTAIVIAHPTDDTMKSLRVLASELAEVDADDACVLLDRPDDTDWVTVGDFRGWIAEHHEFPDDTRVAGGEKMTVELPSYDTAPISCGDHIVAAVADLPSNLLVLLHSSCIEHV